MSDNPKPFFDHNGKVAYNIVTAHSKIIINRNRINVLYENTGRFTFTTTQFPPCSNTMTVILKLKTTND